MKYTIRRIIHLCQMVIACCQIIYGVRWCAMIILYRRDLIDSEGCRLNTLIYRFRVATIPSTAGESDFFEVNESITFQTEEIGPKLFPIELVDDLEVESTETFIVSLTSSAPVKLGQPATVNILDNDGKYSSSMRGSWGSSHGAFKCLFE